MDAWNTIVSFIFRGERLVLGIVYFWPRNKCLLLQLLAAIFCNFYFLKTSRRLNSRRGLRCFLCEPQKRKNKGNIIACPLLKALSKMFFLFPRWNMLVPWSVYTCVCINIPKLSSRTFWSAWVWPHDSLFACLKTPARHRLEAPKMPPGSWGSLEKNSSSWWFQPIWNILVKLDHFLK